MTSHVRESRPERQPASGNGRGARPMQTVALSLFALCVAWLAIALLVVPNIRTPFFAACAAMTATNGAAALLARRGRDDLAAIVVVGNFAVACWFTVVFGGGLEGPFAAMPVAAVVAAALLLGRSAALAATVLSLAAAALVYAFDVSARVPRLVPAAPILGPVAQFAWLLLAAAFAGTAVERQRAAVRRAVESEVQARRLFDQASDAIFVLGPDGRYLDGNESACVLSGRTREELRTLRSIDIVEIDPAELTRDVRTLARDQVLVTERILVRPDGTKRVCESSARRLSDGRTEAIVRDVTERREAERMNRRLGHALDDLTEGILVFDSDERLLYANRAFQDQLRTAIDWSHPPRAEDLAGMARSKPNVAELREAIRAGRRWTERFEVDRGPGGYAVLDASFSPVRSAKDEPMGFIGIIRDVTRELELETKLRQSEKLEALGRLAGGVAHDFNNILTAVLGLAEFQERTLARESEALLAAQEIRASALQGRELTQQLLTFGRKQQVRPQVLDLNGVVSDTAAMLRRVIREDVELILGLDPALPSVEADPTQLRQVLLNLATNARDAMPSGGVLRIETGAEVDADGRWVALSVKDDGEGMDEDTRARIFEPFFTTKPSGQGTGLGLPSVHGIVEQSGGRIEVASRLGVGTTIRIALPAVDRRPAPRTEAPAAPVLAGRFTLLVIEDQEPLRRLIARLLREAGHEVFEAADGRQALAMVADLPPLDLLLTDVVMPGVDGLTVAKELQERDPSLRVLFTSGHAADLVGPASREGTGFVAKPFTAQELLLAVSQTLRSPEP
jgi:two-component system, cell cycle sensor histidine kinase and response regulator CckA